MRGKLQLAIFVTLASMVGVAPAPAATGAEVYEAMGLKTRQVLSGTVLSARVEVDQPKRMVCLATYLTGSKDKSDAVNLVLEIFNETEGVLSSTYRRSFGEVHGWNLADGDLQLIDLDHDGVSEIIVVFRSYRDLPIEQRLGEVIVDTSKGFQVAWAGPMEYDATKAARTVPVERRDRYVREIDYASTLRTRGLTLFMNKTMIAVAGERLDEPQVVPETFPLRSSQPW